MNYIQTEIDGVWLIEPTVYGDQRGYFMESFKQQEFEQHIGRVNFLQDNESKSVFGVLRGLHYQQGEYSQAKLVRVIKGTVLVWRWTSAPHRLHSASTSAWNSVKTTNVSYLFPADLRTDFWCSVMTLFLLIRLIIITLLRPKLQLCTTTLS